MRTNRSWSAAISSASRSRRPSRPSSARSAGSARAAAIATSGVALPSRRSSPTGFPVTSASPNAPSTSSRSWNASPSGSPIARERRSQLRQPAGERGAEVQRPLDRVLRRLVQRDASRRRRVGARGRGRHEVERLSDAELDAELVEDVEHRHRRRTADQHVGVDEREVADEDRHALAEAARLAPPACVVVPSREVPVHGVAVPAHVGTVHDVVVHERERVDELERRGGVDDDRSPSVAAAADERAVAERGAQPLAAGDDERPQLRRAARRARRRRADQRSISRSSRPRMRASTRSATPASAGGNVASRRSMVGGYRAGRRVLGSPSVASGADEASARPGAGEFLSDGWLAALDARARDDRYRCRTSRSLVLEQVVTDVPGPRRGALPRDVSRRRRCASRRGRRHRPT